MNGGDYTAGIQRNAEAYRNERISYEEKYDVLIECPGFSKDKYHGARYYNLGNMADSTTAKRLQPESR